MIFVGDFRPAQIWIAKVLWMSRPNGIGLAIWRGQKAWGMAWHGRKLSKSWVKLFWENFWAKANWRKGEKNGGIYV